VTGATIEVFWPARRWLVLVPAAVGPAIGSFPTSYTAFATITAAAVRKWLRDVRRLRFLCDHFTKMRPYTD
jgi:hypothetical protein